MKATEVLEATKDLSLFERVALLEKIAAKNPKFRRALKRMLKEPKA